MTVNGPGLMSPVDTAPIERPRVSAARRALGRLSLREPGVQPGFSGLSVLLVVLVLLGAGLQNQNFLLQGAVTLSLAIAASGLGLALGFGGEYLLGQGFLFAIGAYVTAVLATVHHWNFWLAWIAGSMVAMLVGLLLSVAGLRISRFYFAMIGFFLVSQVPNLTEIFVKQTGGSAGLPVFPQPSFFGTALSYRGMFLVAVVTLAVVLWVQHSLVRAPFGMSLRRMRESSQVISSEGIAPWRLRSATYAVAGLTAGLGGGIYSHIFGYLQPANFSLTQTILLFAAVLIGGRLSLVGPVLGVFLLYLIPTLYLNISGYTDLLYGAVILLGAVAFREGIVQTATGLARRSRRHDVVLDEVSSSETGGSVSELAEMLVSLRSEAESGSALTCRGPRRHYAGIAALDVADDQGVTVVPGRIHLLLGPNGSGKTTMLNVMSGLVRLEGGSLALGGRDVSRSRSWVLARIGVGRSFQSPTLPPEVSPLELVTAQIGRLDGTAGWQWLLGTPAAHRARRRSLTRARQLLDAIGLGEAATQPCEALSSGQRRLLDVLNALTSRSRILLLDEPAAGLGENDRQLLAELIRQLSVAGLGFLVVEHDLALALSIASDVTVLAAGRIVEQGPPDTVASSPVVREVLLGQT